MAFNDYRQFIKALEKNKEVAHIREEVDWDLEVGAIIRRACETHAPAPLFENIKDYPPGYRILGASVATHRRLAIGLGLEPKTPHSLIQREFEERMEHPVKPVIVKTGACQENILKGNEVDLYRFPVPYEHEGDGCRFIATWHIVVTQDPDSGWVNWGMYRVGVHNKRYLLGHWHGATDAGKVFYKKYVPRKKPMPIAIAIGVDPLCCLAAITPLAEGQNEVDYAGGLRGEPVKLVKCLTSDLQVPADAEIVLEGEILPDVRVMDGPFGDFPGYHTSGWLRRPMLVKAILHRNDPILTVTNLGVPVDDSDICLSLTAAVSLKKHLLKQGLPITAVNVPPEAVGHLAIVSVKTLYSTVASHIHSVIDSRAPEFQHLVIVVDNDVDVFNLGEVLHAFATKCNPARGIKVSSPRLVSGLTPYLSPEERRTMTGASALIDCTWPPTWSKETDISPRVSFKDLAPELRDKVLTKWKTYGFP